MPTDETTSHRDQPRRVMLICGMLLAVAALFRLGQALGVIGFGDQKAAALVLKERPDDYDPATTKRQVQQFCGACHVTPSPETVSRNQWPAEVARGYEFHLASSRTDLEIPPINHVVYYFQSQAPEMLILPNPPSRPADDWFTSETHGGTGEARNVEWPHSAVTTQPGTSHVDLVTLTSDGERYLLNCNMLHGTVALQPEVSSESEPSIEISLRAPARAVVTDLNADGLGDIVVADLGTRTAADINRGQVVWLKQRPVESSDGAGDLTHTAQPDFEEITLLDGRGRIADVQPGDFDGDGDLDVAVAEFGWQKTGSVGILFNIGTVAEPSFEWQQLDARHGAVNVVPADVNGDDRLDLVVAMTQEYETIDVLLNLGDRTFEVVELFAANNPSFGISSMHVTDLDGDDDPDIVFSNGDLLDSYEVKPFHGIHWLENVGGMIFEHHSLTTLPGVMCVRSADLDGDGDRDLAAAAWLPQRARPSVDMQAMDSLIVLKQQQPGQFERFTLDVAACHNVCVCLGDINGDGTTDILAGNLSEVPTQTMRQFSIWSNTAVRDH